MSLTISSYLLPKRNDIIQALDMMLCRNLHLLLSDAHYLIQARMALFYGYFTDILFKKDEEKFKESLKFLFEAIDYTDDKIVVGYHACETLITLIGDKHLIGKIRKLVPDIIELLLKYIEKNTLTLFFDFLNEFVYIYRDVIKDKIVVIIRELVNRAKIEQEALSGTEMKSNYIINQSWNVMRSV